MTAAVETPLNEYTANGATTVFAYTFTVLAISEIALYVDDVLISSGFTISGVGNVGGGSITFTTAPTNLSNIKITRAMPASRATDYQNSGDFLANTVNSDFDRLWYYIQQINLGLSRRPYLPLGHDEVTIDALSEGSLLQVVDTTRLKMTSLATLSENDEIYLFAGSLTKNYDILAEALADPIAALPIGGVCLIAEYALGKGYIHGIYDKVTKNTGVHDGFIYHSDDGSAGGSVFQLKLRVPEDAIYCKLAGVYADGSTDDITAWTRLITYYKSTGIPIIGHKGTSVISDTIEYDTTGDGYVKGLKLIGHGSLVSFFKNTNSSGGPAILLTSGASVNDFQFGGEMRGFGFVEDGSGANSHGIEYRGTWKQKFTDLDFQALNGAGIKATNSQSDSDSSAFVEFDGITAYDCAGAGFTSASSTGGLALHKFKNIDFQNCNGASGNFIIDGMIQYEIDNWTVIGNPSGAGYNANQLGFVFSATNNTPQAGRVGIGELGNSLLKGMVINACAGLVLGDFRIVKRTGENVLTTGIEVADGSSTAVGLTINPIVVSFDDATPNATLFKLGTGIGPDTIIRRPTLNSFASGNIYCSFNSGAEDKGAVIYDSNGGILCGDKLTRVRQTSGTPGTFDIDLLDGNYVQFIFTTAGSYTINPPSSGAADGARFVLGILNASGGSITVTLASGLNAGNYTDPGSGLYTQTEYYYDSASSVWRPMEWTTPA